MAFFVFKKGMRLITDYVIRQQYEEPIEDLLDLRIKLSRKLPRVYGNWHHVIVQDNYYSVALGHDSMVATMLHRKHLKTINGILKRYYGIRMKSKCVRKRKRKIYLKTQRPSGVKKTTTRESQSVF